MKRYTLNTEQFDLCTLTECEAGEYIKVSDMVEIMRQLVQSNNLHPDGVKMIINELAVMGVGSESNMGN